MVVVWILLGLVLLGALWATALRLRDAALARGAWATLLTRRRNALQGQRFEDAMVDGLPEPARRYLRWAIAPGTPLSTAVILRMHGQFGLQGDPKRTFLPMRAEWLLAPPDGFVWRVRMGGRDSAANSTLVSGSDGLLDGRAWTRMWLAGLYPLARPRLDDNLRRSATMRPVLESLWVPAVLLPRFGAQWEAVDANSAAVSFNVAGERYTMNLAVDGEGRPLRNWGQRWSNANADKQWRYQAFGGDIEAVGEFGGYRIPTRFSAGNHYGTPEYFAFFKCEIDSAEFI
jgi:hypothetical protein